jgi:hypothetical protein
MFIERSAARIRSARMLFFLFGALPCAALVGWAVWLRSDGRRDTVRARWQEVVGLPLVIESVEQPRPGVVRARRCAILAADGSRLAELPEVELESSASEDRLRIAAIRCDADLGAVLASLGHEWLRRDVRFPRNCVVEIADFAWRTSDTAQPVVDATSVAGLRVECVAHEDSRAIRVVRQGDEARIIRTPPSADTPEESIAFNAAWREPIPLAVLVAVVGGRVARAEGMGPVATVTGRVEARTSPAGSSGTARVRIEGVDLADCARIVDSQAAGRASLTVERLEWRRDRLAEAVISCEVGAGWVDGRLFDRFSVALGCRPGPAAVAGAVERSFDAAGMMCRLGADGLQISALPGMGGAIACARGGAVLQPPPAKVAVDRLAWMLAPPGTAFVPAEGPGAWLMSVLAPSVGDAPADQGSRAEKPPPAGGGRDF